MALAKLSTEITFSDEQAMLLETADNFFREQAPLTVARDLMLSDTGFDGAQFQQMAELGWCGLAIPEDFGGSALGLGASLYC